VARLRKDRPDYKQVMKFREVACFYENEKLVNEETFRSPPLLACFYEMKTAQAVERMHNAEMSGNWMSMKYTYTSN
jgi:hypothetical protein